MRKRVALKNLLKKQLNDLIDDALAVESIDAKKITQLESLASLNEVYEQLEEPGHRNKWPVFVMFLITLGIISALSGIRRNSTDIEIEVIADEVDISIPYVQKLTVAAPLQALSSVGHNNIHIPRNVDSTGKLQSKSDVNWSHVKISVPEISKDSTLEKPEAGRITLAPLSLPGSSKLRIRALPVINQHAMLLSQDNINIKLTLSGLISLQGGKAQPLEKNFGKGRSLNISNLGEDIDIVLTIAQDQSLFERAITINKIDLIKIYRDQVGKSDFQESTIHSGTIIFNELTREPRPIRDREIIRLKFLEGQIIRLRLVENKISFKLYCRVNELTSGNDDSLKNLMPTWLEWLSAQHNILLLWGSIIYIFGVVLSIKRWWSGKE